MPGDFRILLGAAAFAGCLAHAAGCRAAANAPPPVQPPGPPVHEVPASDRRTADELIRLQEQTMLLKAELRKLEAQAQVAERVAALSRIGSNGRFRTGDDGGADVPRVIAIEGLGRNLSATLQGADGQQFDARAGDILSDGLQIVSVNAGEVVGRRRGHVLHLRTGTAAGPSAGPLPPVIGASGAPGVPGLPPGNPALSRE
ncbi:type IV pilus biogenesis protein PilP [Burkholderia sp. Bp9140]|uniref:type IV pilus biogenesis protein PilP n=1 Tax=Burkholderia sp. Bp9140 TaxID=2184572 RepID=UPI000F58D039|nr:type IV pilus biogenesis protein PilP [Burkholderia sp. Bp9140]RQR49521.1 type IV pilus biogenesis protein PilP [Burkholderia sp. Bp9140]